MTIQEQLLNNPVLQRSSGILLHPTSLPGKYGIGDLGPIAYWFADLLHENHQKLWQMLPLGPTGYGNSPYQSLSAFAGNPLLISIDFLLKDRLISELDISGCPYTDLERVDFGKVIPYKFSILEKSFDSFTNTTNRQQKKLFNEFKILNNDWLDDYALFSSIKQAHDGKPWYLWPEGLKNRKNDSLTQWREKNLLAIEREKFYQFLFFRQLQKFKKYVNDKAINLIGDLPIYVAHDSVDVWANKKLFYLNSKGELTFVSGVPPDLFSETGQLWGNPIYRWSTEKKELFHWWSKRFKHWFSFLDVLRLDHFRGFEAFWQVSGTEKSAINGEWVKGPGEEFFRTTINNLGSLNIIAEDLGVITAEVKDLKKQFKFPGMKIFQFAFNTEFSMENEYLPHNYEENSVAYSGTHDNQTIIGWYASLSSDMKLIVDDYVNRSATNIFSDILKLCHRSKSVYVIYPLQDILRMDDASIMNRPSKEGDNWEWRFTKEQINKAYFQELKAETEQTLRA